VQRRITVAVLVVAVAAVVLAGVGTTLLSWRQVRHDTVAQLTDEAQALEPFVTRETAKDGSTSPEAGRLGAARVRAARQALGLVDASVLVVDDSGRVVAGTMPDGVDAQAVASTDESAPRHGERGRLAWAAASSAPSVRGRRIVVVLTRQVPFAFGALRWVVVSGAVSVALAVLAAWLVARRITGPLRTIESATQRIAAGDFATRVGEPPAGAGEEAVQLARSIDAMAGSLERSRGTEREFLLAISHDLRTPLTSMRGYAEAIGDGAIDDPRDAAAVILRESRRLERLVADLLDLARLESRQFSLRPESADLASLVRASADGFVPEAAAAGIALEVRGVGSPIAVTVDVDRFAQVLANLIENALKFAATRVVVEVGTGEGGATVAVVDDGPGIAPADLPHVFERRYVARARPGGDAPTSVGTGLGLAIVRELVSAMGGTVVAGPGIDGGGTAVAVRLPAPQAAGEQLRSPLR
jgi:two-component system sensor histidine kinase BaeS